MITLTVKKDSKWRDLYSPRPNIRYVLVYGPRLGGKSYRASQALMAQMGSWPYLRGYIMRNVLDTVRDSIFQDCVDRVNEMGLPYRITDLTLSYLDSEIKGKGFKKSSGNDTAKQKSLAGRNVVLIEEAEEVTQEDFNQLDLSLRTTKGQVVVYLVFNPPEKGHWILKEWFNLIPDEEHPEFFHMQPKTDRTDTAYIFSNYKDNLKHLDPNVVARAERFKETNLEYYLHKIVGLVPSGKTGRIFKKYSIISRQEYDELPDPEHYGLDFGYSNDPTAFVGHKIHNNKLYVREYLYETGLTNPMIADKLSWVKGEIVADSAEPKSIEELNNLGLFVTAAQKGADSINNGIQKINQFELHVVEGSTNLMNEMENYCWKLDKNKEPTNIPEDNWNHGSDALRYSLRYLGVDSVDFDLLSSFGGYL